MLKQEQVNVFDLGNVRKYQLSKFKDKGGDLNMVEGEFGSNEREQSLTEIYKLILGTIPKSRIILIGGADDVAISLYLSKMFSTIVHLDSAIDAQPKFKLVISDKDAAGKPVFPPSYHEHHRSFLRNIYKYDQSDWLK
jgi:hypothetical protein